MNDRFVWGFVAGLLADIIKVGLNLFNFYILHFTKLRYLDFTAILLIGHKPNLFIEAIIAQFAELLWASLLGAAFAYLIAGMPKNLLFKSIIYGLCIWFFAHAVTTLFKVPYLTIMDWKTMAATSLSSVIYGFLLGFILKRFQKV